MRAQISQADGTTVAYDVSGSGPPVVFVHGLTNSRTAWEPVTRLLRDDFTCVRVDLRGHGESSRASEYGMPLLVSDVHAVADDLGLDAPAVVGHSLGGTVAAIYAAAHPARAAVSVDVGLRWGDFAEQLRPYADRLLGDGCMQAVLEIDRELGVGPYAGAAEMERRVLAFPPEVVQGIWRQLLTTPPEQLTQLAEAILGRITVPLLALHGRRPPGGYDEWLTRVVPTARVEVWDGSGHFLHLVDPDRFAVRLRELLRPAS